MSDKCVAIVSGGLDSTTMLYKLIDTMKLDVMCVSFDYGQRHKKELDYAEATADTLDIPWTRVDLSTVTDLLTGSGSSLVAEDSDVPEGHYAEDNMSRTVVPNRNAMMINIAAAYAVAEGAQFVATGVHAGDHYQYPDCRPEFIRHQQETLLLANEGFIEPSFTILAPFLYSSKADIATEAFDLAVTLGSTWSCYKGGEHHCGRCGTCVERLEAIAEAATRQGVRREEWDDTVYEDDQYWMEAVASFQR